MTTPLLFDPVTLADAPTATLLPGVAPARVITGVPQAHELVLHETADLEVGIWEITAGSFHSSKHGVSEFMYFLSGSGTITRANGEVITIAAGTYLSLPDGSEVVWDVTETSRKVYIVTQTPTQITE